MIKMVKGDIMKKNDEEKVNFDLSKLSLQELVKVYTEITDFMQQLDEFKIVLEEKVEENG